jgi:hypothetical protein
MGLYGPFTAVAATIQKCEVAADADAIYVRNTSIYDLAISFKPGQPISRTSFGGDDWYTIVPSGDRVGIRVPDGIYGANGFPGWLWVLHIDNTGSLALSGVSSANTNYWIETYTDAAMLPGDYASPQFQNVASQPRVINVPIGLTHFAQSLQISGVAGTENIIGNANLSAAQLASLSCAIYLYHMLLSPVEATPANGIDIVFRIRFKTGAGGTGANVGSPFDFARISLTQGGGGIAPSAQFSPAWPYVAQFNGSVPNTALSVSAILLTAGASASINYSYTVAWNLDPSNIVPVADIGVASLYNSSQARF